MAIDLHPILIDFEYVAAMERFDAGLLEDEPRRPRSWNLEVSANPWERRQLAARVEHAADFPERPKWQYGVAASYGFRENLILTANYLRGEFQDEKERRTLFQVELIYEY